LVNLLLSDSASTAVVFADERILERWIGNVGEKAVLTVTEETEKPYEK
jgi:hypothetical protein